jgi:hypothetical protein
LVDASLDEDGVAPATGQRLIGHERDALTDADSAESLPVVQAEAGLVVREDARLDSPVAELVGR